MTPAVTTGQESTRPSHQESWFNRPPMLVPGTVIVCYLVATGRWGSHIGWYNKGVYVTDIALAVTAGWAVVRHRRHLRITRRLALVLAIPTVAIPVWALLRMLTNAQFDLLALRDLAPFLYVSVALVGLVVVDQAARRRTFVALAVALVLHATWVWAAMHFPIARWYLSGGLLRVFEIRPDFDSAMLAVLSALALHQLVRRRIWWQRAVALVLVLWPVHTLFQTGSRAGALALVVALTITTVSLLRSIHLSRRQALACGVLLIIAAAVALPQTSLYGRLTGDPEFAKNSTAGTTSAREEAWTRVFEYVSESPTRVVLGVGPGPDYLVASGARPFFGQVHQGDIRVPHNVLLSYYARLGLIGLGLFLVLLASWARACWWLVATRRLSQLDLANVLMSATLLLASLVGVIIESPFGAIPFFWALGQLVSSWAADRSTLPGGSSRATAT